MRQRGTGPTLANAQNKRLFELMDRLHGCNEEMVHHAIRRKSRRLDIIEKNAKSIEQTAKLIQEQVNAMRRQ